MKDKETVKPQATFSLAKGLHYTIFAADYFKDVIRQEQLIGSSKNTVTGWVNRLDWIIKDVFSQMRPRAAQLLREELKNRDIAGIDSILNMVIALNEEQRSEVEEYISKTYLNEQI